MNNPKIARVYIGLLGVLLVSGTGLAFGQDGRANAGFRKGKGGSTSPTTPPATPATTPNQNCTLILPAYPLSAAGLATPFQLKATDLADGPCNEANTAQSAFAQAVIFDPATGSVYVYNPLVIDEGTTPAAPPVVPTLPPHAIVALWFGYNAENLLLAAESPSDLANANCVNGLGSSLFTQVSYCNAPAFFAAANSAIADGTLMVPRLGTAADGLACPTVRDFFVVDQDQSDNLPTLYLAMSDGTTAQYNRRNLSVLSGATVVGNPSDNHLTDAFLDPALSCEPWTVPDLTNLGQTAPAQALNELQARMHQGTPVALVPGGDPMTEVSGNEDIAKTNLYRMGVDQPMAESVFDTDTSRYCRQMLRIAPSRMLRDQAFLTIFASPVTTAANSLFTFMAQRFVASYQILNCDQLIQQADPITLVTNASGVTTSASVNTLMYHEELQDIAGQKSADDAADSIARSRGAVQ